MTATDRAKASRLDHGRLSEINLEQALLDFEVANARVLDLTQRLTSITSELLATRQQLESSRMSASQAQAELDAVRDENQLIKASLAYRGLRLVGDMRARILH